MQRTEIDTNLVSNLLEEEAKHLAFYNIGFVVPQSKDNTKDGMLGGSGSLVSIDGVEGVLTAEHVVSGLRERETAGIILTSREGVVHEAVFKTGYCQHFSYRASDNQSGEGPDLSFLVLPPDTTATLKAKQSFYNLSKRREAMLDPWNRAAPDRASTKEAGCALQRRNPQPQSIGGLEECCIA